MTTAPVSFTGWLAKHRKRENPLGDLARDVARDKNWPSDGDLPRFERHMMAAGACSAALRTLSSAWKKYHRWRSGIGTVNSRLRFEILTRDNFTCQYCGKKAPSAHLEVDHVVPHCQGGSNRRSNLKTSCTECNRGKFGRDLEEVLATVQLDQHKGEEK